MVDDDAVDCCVDISQSWIDGEVTAVVTPVTPAKSWLEVGV